MQSSLFVVYDAAPASSIPGLRYLPEYINQQEEAEMIRIIDAQPWITELKRRVQHYGYRYDYKARSVTPQSYLGPLPEWLSPSADRLRAGGLMSHPYASCVKWLPASYSRMAKPH